MFAKTSEGIAQGQASHDCSLQTFVGQQFGRGAAWKAEYPGAFGGNWPDYQSESFNAKTVIEYTHSSPVLRKMNRPFVTVEHKYEVDFWSSFINIFFSIIKHWIEKKSLKIVAKKYFVLVQLGETVGKRTIDINVKNKRFVGNDRYPELSDKIGRLMNDYVLALRSKDETPGLNLAMTREAEAAILDKYQADVATKQQGNLDSG